MDSHENDTPELPEDLVQALKRADKRVTPLTIRVDREIRAASEAQFGTTPARRRPARWLAAAAVAAIAIAVVPMYRTEQVSLEPELTIVDVMRLAREGTVSQDELDRLAMTIVSVRSGDGA